MSEYDTTTCGNKIGSGRGVVVVIDVVVAFALVVVEAVVLITDSSEPKNMICKVKSYWLRGSATPYFIRRSTPRFSEG